MIQQQRQAISRHRILDKKIPALVHGRSPSRIRATRDSHSLCQGKSFVNLTSQPWTRSLSGLTPDRLIALMVGRELSDLFPGRAQQLGQVRLSCRELCLPRQSVPVSFELRAGEILGLAGLEGQGQSEIVRALIGQHDADGGEITVGCDAMRLPLTPRGGVRLMQRMRVGFVPEDRKEEGLLLGADISENIGIGLQATRPAFKPLKRVRDIAGRIFAEMKIKAANMSVPAGALSGGNQQKVLLGRYLASDMDVLMIEEPTRGVDIGAKAEIYRLLRALAEQGKAILILSRETVELIGLCDRLLIIHDRRVVGEMAGEQATEYAILNAALNR